MIWVESILYDHIDEGNAKTSFNKAKEAGQRLGMQVLVWFGSGSAAKEPCPSSGTTHNNQQDTEEDGAILQPPATGGGKQGKGGGPKATYASTSMIWF